MGDSVPFKAKDDYQDLTIKKTVDGKEVEYVDIDSMTEDQFKKYCRDTGTEWFQRFVVTLGK